MFKTDETHSEWTDTHREWWCSCRKRVTLNSFVYKHKQWLLISAYIIPREGKSTGLAHKDNCRAVRSNIWYYRLRWVKKEHGPKQYCLCKNLSHLLPSKTVNREIKDLCVIFYVHPACDCMWSSHTFHWSGFVFIWHPEAKVLTNNSFIGYCTHIKRILTSIREYKKVLI